MLHIEVSVPYEITLLSNLAASVIMFAMFQYLMKLHYSQTLGVIGAVLNMFQYLMKLHYSQTASIVISSIISFSTL